MARILRFVENMAARFPTGTFGQIDAVLKEGEDRASFVRAAVEREIKRRLNGRRSFARASSRL